jgi:predicted outer membrane repeat protein
LTPAVFNVAAGDTAGFIAAINASNVNNQPDTIELAAGSTYTFSAVADPADGGSALPTIVRDTADANTLTIHGNGATLQRSLTAGTPTFRFLRSGVFPNNIAVTVSNLSFFNGDAGLGKGGAILLQAGDLTLTGCTFANDQADTGGAVYVTTTSVAPRFVSVASSMFTGDTANGSNNGGAGGAFYSSGASSVDIEGSTFSGNTSAKEGGAVRVQTSSATITVGGSTFANNTANGGNGGGAIFVQGPTTITNTTVRDNVSAVGGGGIWVQSGGSLVLTGSTVSTNSANSSTSGGGGVFSQAALTVVNSTITGNRGGNGGGIAFVNGAPTGTITNSTITDNRAFFGLATGGGIEVTGTGTLSIGDTIVAGNGFDAGVSGTGPDIGGPVVSLGYNLIQDPTGSTITGNSTGNINGVSPNLGLLQNNGGPTATRLPLPGSPVVDAGDPAFAPPPATDQRGLPRVQNGRTDIGSVEVQVQPLTVAAVAVNNGSAQRSEVRSIAVTFSGPATFTGGNGNAAAAFQLNHVQTGNNVALASTVSTDAHGRTVVTLTFSGSETDAVSGQNSGALSLADGRYTLTIASGSVSDSTGAALDGDANGTPGGNYVSPADTLGGGAGQLHLYRLFGDVNGDGVVDQQDLGQFRSTFNTDNTNPLYLAFLDANNDGFVDQQDLGQFRGRFNVNVF